MFAVNDGVVTLNGVPVDQLSEEQRRNAYGRTGDLGLGAQLYDFSTGAKPNQQFDPRYWEAYDINRGDSDTVTGYRLRPEYSHLQGMMQTGLPRSVGGAGEAIDPSGITFDEEFGYLTPLTNIKQPESTWLQQYLPYMLAAANLGAVGAAGGFSGLLGGAGAGGTNLGTYASMTTGLDGLTGTLAGEGAAAATAGTMATIPESLLQNITIPPLDIANPTLASLEGLTSAPWYQQLGQYALNNPLSTGRAVLGLAGLVDGLLNKPNSGGSPSNPGSSNPNGATVPALNPAGLLSGYKPMQFDPVPFMSGRYGG